MYATKEDARPTVRPTAIFRDQTLHMHTTLQNLLSVQKNSELCTTSAQKNRCDEQSLLNGRLCTEELRIKAVSRINAGSKIQAGVEATSIGLYSKFYDNNSDANQVYTAT